MHMCSSSIRLETIVAAYRLPCPGPTVTVSRGIPSPTPDSEPCVTHVRRWASEIPDTEGLSDSIHRNRRESSPTWRALSGRGGWGYSVPVTSHLTVASNARAGRRLLAEQQVMSPNGASQLHLRLRVATIV